jgi:cytochrome c oxidase subunit 2
MFWVSFVVLAFVLAMAAWGIARGRARREEDLQRIVPWGDRFILVSGLGVTTVILVAFFILSLHSMATLAARSNSLEITVIGHDWWWEVRYPNGAVTANEIHIPAGRRVDLQLRSADVIHSIWVPQLGPKIDLIPGRDNTVWFEADKPGTYRGQCAEFCGLEHARMAFLVIADPPDAFDTWEKEMAAPAAVAGSDLQREGQSIFLSNTCIGCHAIRGTPADGQLGPDLTHLASRQTIAAGTVPLTPGTLQQWILDPGSIKPGVTMPPTQLSPDDVRALVAYLLGLGLGGAS